MFFSGKKKKEKMEKSAVKGVVEIFGDNMRSAGVGVNSLPRMKSDKKIIGSLYGFCVSAADTYGDVDGMRVFILSYGEIFGVYNSSEIELVAKDALFDDEVNQEAEKTYNNLLTIADSGMSQKEAMLFMKDKMLKYSSRV